MTLEAWTKKYLTDRGMFRDQADAVFAKVVEDSALESMRGRWHDQVEHYPPSIPVVLAISIDKVALAWIDENKPKAWYRDVFVRSTVLQT
jgi:hypothetical protein